MVTEGKVTTSVSKNGVKIVEIHQNSQVKKIYIKILVQRRLISFTNWSTANICVEFRKHISLPFKKSIFWRFAKSVAQILF